MIEQCPAFEGGRQKKEDSLWLEKAGRKNGGAKACGKCKHGNLLYVFMGACALMCMKKRWHVSPSGSPSCLLFKYMLMVCVIVVCGSEHRRVGDYGSLCLSWLNMIYGGRRILYGISVM